VLGTTEGVLGYSVRSSSTEGRAGAPDLVGSILVEKAERLVLAGQLAGGKEPPDGALRVTQDVSGRFDLVRGSSSPLGASCRGFTSARLRDR